MHKRQKGNLGATRLRKKRRTGDPMDTYDALPQPLRNWLAQASLPWSPTSARRIWSRAHAQGRSIDDTLHALSLAEARTLARGQHSTPHSHTS
ncbi:DUF6525 family protein [Sulfitobacter sp. HNIBRBA2951]|uniref:DUF6525 family protein n=1 Tax=Sulfitobacter aquimarinus TaxID=3158557 RepID=UPI0032DE6F94